MVELLYQVVTQNTLFNPGLIAISNLGFGGAIAHVVLKPYRKLLEKRVEQSSHRLVLVSGRTLEAVDYFLENVKKNQTDLEFLSLVDEIHSMNVDGHIYRG